MEEGSGGTVLGSCLGVPSRELQRPGEKIRTLGSREGPTPCHAASNLEGLGLAWLGPGPQFPAASDESLCWARLTGLPGA